MNISMEILSSTVFERVCHSCRHVSTDVLSMQLFVAGARSLL